MHKLILFLGLSLTLGGSVAHAAEGKRLRLAPGTLQVRAGQAGDKITAQISLSSPKGGAAAELVALWRRLRPSDNHLEEPEEGEGEARESVGEVWNGNGFTLHTSPGEKPKGHHVSFGLDMSVCKLELSHLNIPQARARGANESFELIFTGPVAEAFFDVMAQAHWTSRGEFRAEVFGGDWVECRRTDDGNGKFEYSCRVRNYRTR